jgi:hypothetical protein
MVFVYYIAKTVFVFRLENRCSSGQMMSIAVSACDRSSAIKDPQWRRVASIFRAQMTYYLLSSSGTHYILKVRE